MNQFVTPSTRSAPWPALEAFGRRFSTAWLPLLLVVLGFTLYAAQLLPVGAGNLGIAALFSTDEELAGRLVRAMINQSNLGVSHFFSYGPLDLYLARAILWPYGALRPVDDAAILIALRLVSLLSGIGCLVVTWMLGRLLWNATTGLLSALLLALNPTFFTWSVTAHPDVLQLLFLLLALYLATGLVVRPSGPLIALASVCAALAFATKYGGIMALPPIWLATAIGRQHGRYGLRLVVHDIELSVLVFAIAFFVVDPSTLSEPRRFIYQAMTESNLAHTGHFIFSPTVPAGWLRLLGRSELLGTPLLVAALAGIVGWASADVRAAVAGIGGWFNGWESAAARLPFETWTLGYLLFLLLWVGDRQPRYALPLLPGLFLLAAAGGVCLARRLPRPALATGLAAAILLLLAAPSAVRLVETERAQAGRMQSPTIAARIAAGRWLSAHAAPQTPILHDAYSYVPSRFSNAQETFGLSPGEIERYRPQIIVTDVAIRGRFLDPALAAQFRGGPAAFEEIARTYAQLESGDMPCYPRLDSFGPVQVYGSLTPGSCQATS